MPLPRVPQMDDSGLVSASQSQFKYAENQSWPRGFLNQPSVIGGYADTERLTLGFFHSFPSRRLTHDIMVFIDWWCGLFPLPEACIPNMLVTLGPLEVQSLDWYLFAVGWYVPLFAMVRGRGDRWALDPSRDMKPGPGWSKESSVCTDTQNSDSGTQLQRAS